MSDALAVRNTYVEQPPRRLSLLQEQKRLCELFDLWKGTGTDPSAESGWIDDPDAAWDQMRGVVRATDKDEDDDDDEL